MLKNFQFTLRRFHYGACTHYIPFLLLIDICERWQKCSCCYGAYIHIYIHYLISNFIFRCLLMFFMESCFYSCCDEWNQVVDFGHYHLLNHNIDREEVDRTCFSSLAMEYVFVSRSSEE